MKEHPTADHLAGADTPFPAHEETMRNPIDRVRHAQRHNMKA
jgi:hypothetical protein